LYVNPIYMPPKYDYTHLVGISKAIAKKK
jgi:hypothetical protein